MKAIDYIIIALAAIGVLGVVLHLWRRKKQGKNGCGCGCNGCKNTACPSFKQNTEEENND